METNNPLVSIVLPAYGVAALLPKCLDSLCKQTYRNLEIIVVDDGSPDESGKIADTWARTDERITVIHQKNGGCANARNNGFKASRGDYIIFIDPDDYVSHDAIEVLVKAAVSDDFQLVLCNHDDMWEDGSRPTRKLYEGVDFVEYSNAGFKQHLPELLSNLYVCEPWNKLIKRDLLEKSSAYFPEDMFASDDQFFCFSVFTYAERVKAIPDVLYHYLHRSESLTHKFKTAIFDNRLSGYDRVRKIVASWTPEHLGLLDDLLVSDLIDPICALYTRSGFSFQEKRKFGASLLSEPRIKLASKEIVPQNNITRISALALRSGSSMTLWLYAVLVSVAKSIRHIVRR